MVSGEEHATLLCAYRLTRAVGSERFVSQRLCEAFGESRRKVALCKIGIRQLPLLSGRCSIFVVTCQRDELLETIVGGQDSRADVEVVGDET